ncbi:MAG TPA: PfkB family carbohydrate kinase [Bacteroidales bacterium]|nr:PfkB family carbohydrate kinase [Bacteroidales bacterium]
MQKIYTTGECILDIAFRDGAPFFIGPGGSKLNTAVSLGRAGMPVSMISDCSDDPVGTFIMSFLHQNGVSTEFIARYRGQVRVAFAFLDDRNDADYTFYPGSRLADRQEEKEPVFAPGDIFVYGSFYALKEANRLRINRLLDLVSLCDCIRIYDPNYRKPHLKELDVVGPYIHDCIRQADIVRGSDEDFGNIFNTTDPDRIFDAIRTSGGRTLILTQGGRDVLLFSERIRKSYPVPGIQTVSTIGAGDGFNAGLIYELVRCRISRHDLPALEESVWDKLVRTAISFASHVCCEKNNYISVAFASKLRSAGKGNHLTI